MMQGRIIFLLEEPSMKVLLDNWLPRLFPGWVERQHFLCIQHEGKSDLDRSIPRAARTPGHVAGDHEISEQLFADTPGFGRPLRLVVFHAPVEPNPLAPRAVGGSSATRSKRQCATGTTMPCAMRSPFFQENELAHTNTMNSSPR